MSLAGREFRFGKKCPSPLGNSSGAAKFVPKMRYWVYEAMAGAYGQLVIGVLFTILVVEVVVLAPDSLNSDSEKQTGVKDLADELDASGLQQAMRGVHLIETSEGEKEWELWADQALAFQTEQHWSLETVKAIFTGNDGVYFVVTGDSGDVEPETKNMRVRGNVRTESSNGYVFETDFVDYDSSTRLLKSPNQVQVWGPKGLKAERFEMEGVGMDVHVETSQVELLSEVKATRGLKDGRTARIRSDRASLSGVKNSASFHGDVVIDLDDMRIAGPDAEFLYNEASSEVESLKVSNGVQVSDALKYATSENLTVDFDQRKFVFRGSPRVVQNNDELIGEEIVFLDGGDRVKVQKVRARVDEDSLQEEEVKRLSIQGISKSFKQRQVVKGVTFQVDSGQVVGLLGPNGAGKTTSFYMVVGLVKPDQGTVTVDDKEIGSLPMYQRARNGLSYLPQESSIFRRLTVTENLLVALQAQGYNSGETRARLQRLLDDFSIQHIRDSYGYSLSGGERRRVEIARSLAGPQTFCCWTNRLLGLIRLLSTTFRK